ncbi:hypothetical protein AcV5_006608 [Taiwanofungus camphoratus]|nr:hypothetical protein AcV5_006608 [Antrodia cinnamomea]
MLGQSLPEYIFIRTAIFGLRLVAPLSIAYTLASWHTRHFLFSFWLGVYALTEASFYVCVYLPRCKALQKAATHPPLMSREEREAVFNKCFSNLRETNAAAGWFYPSSPSAIKRENMMEWLSWALFSARSDGFRKEWEAELEGYVTKLEGFMGQKFAPGWDEKVKCMRVSFDHVVTVHRPLVWYLIIALLDTYTSLVMFSIGFKHFDICNWFSCFPPRLCTIFSQRSPNRELVYWYRPHRSKTKQPVLFFHGIGIGLWPYLGFLRELIAAEPDVGIIAIENLSVSMRISAPPLPREVMLAALTRILDFHALPRVVLTSHSYGTIIAAHILRDPVLSRRVSASLLVDPIPFLLHLPAVAYNFVYRSPRAANEWQLWYFASRDPDVARALARHFFWAQNVLWKDDLQGREVAVVLSGKDQILDAREVRRYLTESDNLQFSWRQNGLEVLYYRDLDHAMVFDTKDRRRPMVDILSKFVRYNVY